MKRIISATLVFMLALIIFTPTALNANEINVSIDGVYVDFPDQPPVIVDGRVLVPVRGVFEALGFNVEWYQDTQTVILWNHYYEIAIIVGVDTFFVNGLPRTFLVPPQIIEGRVMLPIRAVVESVGLYIGWNANDRTALITSSPIVIALSDDLHAALADFREFLTTPQTMQSEAAVVTFEPTDILHAELIDFNNDGLPGLLTIVGQDFENGEMLTYRAIFRAYTGGESRGVTWSTIGRGETVSWLEDSYTWLELAETAYGRTLVVFNSFWDYDGFNGSRAYFEFVNARSNRLLITQWWQWDTQEDRLYWVNEEYADKEYHDTAGVRYLDIINTRDIFGDTLQDVQTLLAEIDAMLSHIPGLVAVPSHIGMELEAAQDAFEAIGLQLAVYGTESSDDIPIGHITQSTFLEGAMVGVGTTVYIVTSLGYEPEMDIEAHSIGDLPYTIINAQGQRVYIVQADDTMWTIAMRIYGDGTRYRDILEANDLTPIRAGLLMAGTELAIPD